MRSSSPDNDMNLTGDPSLKDVGTWLRGARELKGESLDDVSKITRIGKNYLEAIEEGSYAKLPSQAYARGFVRLYAAHLGLSPEEALDMLGGRSMKAPMPGRQEQSEPVAVPHPLSEQTPGKKGTKKLIIFLSCAAALAVIVLFLVKRDGHRNQPTGAPRDRTMATPSNIEPAPPLPVPVMPPPASPLPAAEPPQQAATGEAAGKEGIVLRLKAVSNGRLHITIDGSISQEYDLVAGDLVEWKADTTFLLDLEDAGSVEGELDGKPMKPLGEAGKAAHLIISPDGVQKN
jgi:transcriptional regulator with XRE-family HTH domain